MNRYFISKLECCLSSYIGSKFVICTSMGRTAFSAIFDALEIKKGDEVIVPAYVCEVVPNAIIKHNATPIFVDIDYNTYHISLNHLQSLISDRTKGIIINHIFGYPEDVYAIRDILSHSRGEIFLIEDVAHAMGAEYKGKKAGTLGDIGVFSLPKSILSLGGGFITTNNPLLAMKMKNNIEGSHELPLRMTIFFGLLSLIESRIVNSYIWNALMQLLQNAPNRLQFATNKYMENKKVPEQLRMSNIQAIIALYQVKTIDKSNKKRNDIKKTLDSLVKKHKHIYPISPQKLRESTPTCSWYVIRCKDQIISTKFFNICKKNHIFATRIWDPLFIEQDKSQKNILREVPQSLDIAKTTIVFKINPNWSYRSVKQIGNKLTHAMGECDS